MADLVLFACVGAMLLTVAWAAVVWVIGRLFGGRGRGGGTG